MAEEGILITEKRLSKFVKKIFLAAGLSDKDSSIISKHLVLANLRGVDSHGVSRVKIYIERLKRGLIEKDQPPIVEKETNTSALINGNNRFGILNAYTGIQLAVKKAKENGIGVIGVHNSNHCGMLADYVEYAAQNNCIAFATTNAPSNMPPWGGKEAFFGTNPLAYGIPTNTNFPIIFDMATSVVARGKITYAMKNNQKIPLGWAMTKSGEPTTDPNEALEGLVLPVGGPKGYGLALFVETLSSIFTGAAYGHHIASLVKDFDRPQKLGHFFFVMKANLFEDLDVFLERMDRMINDIKQVPLAAEYERIFLPGEIESLEREMRKKEGIYLPKNIVEEINDVARDLGLHNDLL